MAEIQAPTKIPEPAPKKSLSRRQFLRLGATAALGLLFRSDKAQIPLPVLRAEDGLAVGFTLFEQSKLINPLLSVIADRLDDLVRLDRRPPEAPKVEPNPHYRPMKMIISEAVTGYVQKGGRVFYQPHEDWQETRHYIFSIKDQYRDWLANFKKGERKSVRAALELLDGLAARTSSGLNLAMPETARRLVYDTRPTSLHYFVIEGTGVYDRVYQRKGLHLPKRSDFQSVGEFDQAWSDYLKEGASEAVKDYFEEIKSFTESAVTQNNGKPISVSRILDFVLEKNQGDLTKSLLDVGYFLAFMARNDYETGYVFSEERFDSPRKVVNEEWIKKHILDEYSQGIDYATLPVGKTFPYQGLLKPILEDAAVTQVLGESVRRDEDLCLFSQIGKPYHAWSVAARLSVLPAPILKMIVIGNQVGTRYEQGLNKVAADFHLLAELDDLESYFGQFRKVK